MIVERPLHIMGIIFLLLVLSNGLVLQFGFAWNPTFPITFNKILTCIANGIQWGYAVNINTIKTNKVTFNQWQSANGSNNTKTVYWIAIGY